MADLDDFTDTFEADVLVIGGGTAGPQRRFAEIRADLPRLVARDAHELMRALEVHSILECADMAAAASHYRTESRWGLYHYRLDYPAQDDANWFCHVQLFKDETGATACKKRPVDLMSFRSRQTRKTPIISCAFPLTREAVHALC